MLTKNTVQVRFLHVEKLDGNFKYRVWKQHPLSKPYTFYVDENQRKKMDIGTIVHNHNAEYEQSTDHPYVYGVVVDNQDQADAQAKHRPIEEIIKPGHLRTFLYRQFHIQRRSATAKLIYQAFRNASKDYRNRQHSH